MDPHPTAWAQPRRSHKPGPRPNCGRAAADSMRARRGKGSEGETTTNCRGNVVVVVIGDSRAVGNGDGQTAADVGVCNAGIGVETFGEVMIRIERNLVEEARAGSAEAAGRAGRRNTEVLVPLMIGGQSDVGLAVESVFHARPGDLHEL